MAIGGPKVQMPQANAPFTVQTDDERQSLTQEAAAFLSALQSISFYSTRNGPTASRPTGSSDRWIGMPYFDTSLGKPVFLKIASTNIWVDGSGAAV